MFLSGMNAGDYDDFVMTQVPELAHPRTELYRSLWQQPHIPPQTLELCRLRLAQLHRCESEWRRSDGAVEEGMRALLGHGSSESQFSEAERACLAFAEVYAMDVQAISDEQAEAVKAHHGDAGLVMLIEALGIFDGMARLSLLWGPPAQLPEAEGVDDGL